ncbi:MAG: HAMP domain-containing histidine kinase, partial [Thermodesulfovibrionales bacterium]|nr:HAMP domain-containing histidine kinase [Thermodesulfovibrionales bacterium]
DIDITKDGWRGKEHHVEFFCKKADRWFDCYIFYQEWLDGSAVRMILGTDITEKKRLIKEIARKIKQLKQLIEKETEIRKQTEKMLEHQSKLASLGEVMGAIAHQWKQPLNYIALIIQDVQESFARQELTEEKMTNAVHLTMQQLQFLSNTIDDFRSFVRMQHQDKRFDVFKAIHKIVSMFSAILKEQHINIELFGQMGKYLINGNENDIKHVILNLINNAKDAICSSRRNGNMPIDEVGIIEITLEKSDYNIIITVSDNGGGIPDDIINSVFDPYFTTKYEGTGIGLYICKNLVEQSFGGSISVVNGNRGAVFTIKIPLENDMLF